MRFEFDSTDIDNAISKLRELSKEVDRIEKHMAEQTIGRAKANATKMKAVDTGRLRRNIEYKKTEDGFLIESEAIDPKTGKDYAPEVHYGLAVRGRNSVPRPYLQEAFNWLKVKFPQEINRIFEKILK